MIDSIDSGSIRLNKMTTHYPQEIIGGGSGDAELDNRPDDSTITINEEEMSLIDPRLVSAHAPKVVRKPSQESKLCRQSSNNARTMSPRIPRKRIVGNNSKDDLEDEYEMQLDETPPSVIITPTSPAHRSYHSGHDIGSPINSSDGSYRKPNWTIDIERDGGDQLVKIETSRRYPHPNKEEMEDDDDNHKKSGSKSKNGIDVSLYTTKKNVAQGMLDIALLSANCSQLKYLLFHYERDGTSLAGDTSGGSGVISPAASHPGQAAITSSWLFSYDFYFIVNLVCIAISIGLQVIVGILLILNGRHNVYVHRYQRVADSYSNLILVTVFVITIVNIFLSVFISAR